MKDVAKHASVGLGTVSRAINNSPRITPETKKKVFDSIRALGFVPDPVAQSMRSLKYRNIAYLVGDISNPAFAQYAKGIQEYLETMGYTLSLCNTGDEDVAEKVRSFLEGRKLDGVILSLPREDDQKLLELLGEIHVPIVTLDRDVPNVPAGIITDYYSSILEATQYLIQLGHKGIALLTGTRNIRPTRVSIDGFREAFRVNSLPFSDDFILEGELTTQFGIKAMKRLLPDIRKGKITAVITLSHQIFQGVLRVMRDNEVDYPRDVSLITVEDSELTQLLKPAVTVIKRPLIESGHKIAKLLTQYIQKPELMGKASPISVSTEFIIRNSCRKVE